MNTLEFLRAILPEDGVYYTAIFKPGFHAPAHKAFHNLSAMADAIVKMDAGDWTVYHACASYKEEFVEVQVKGALKKKYRIDQNWNKAKCFWADLDCGETKAAEGKGYLTKRDAATAMKEFCDKTGFPKPFYVDSGNGIHAYWPLTTAINSDTWVKMATVLKAVFAHHGVLADTSRTSDFASILRPVGSHNKKTDDFKPVIAKNIVDPIDPKQFAVILKELAADLPKKAVPEPVKKYEINDDLTSHLPQTVHMDSSARTIAEKCNQMAIVRDNRGNVDYEQWRGALGIIKFCVEGNELAHEWSSGHAEYDYDATEEKIDSWETPPTTCRHFQSHNPKGCSGCQHLGSIKTPIVLGKYCQTVQTTIANEIDGISTNGLISFPYVTNSGKPRAHTENLKKIAKAHGVDMKYNLMSKKVQVSIPGFISVTDEFDNNAITYIQDLVTQYDMPTARIPEQINHVGSSNPFCPVQQFITSKPWDGEPRLQRYAAQITTSERPVLLLFLRKWLIQAIAAVFENLGLSAAGVLVLVGPQGIGKTQFFRQLAAMPVGAFLEGATLNPADKDSVSLVISRWIVELGELDATFKKADIAQIKAFLTRNTDTFRRPYGRKDSEFPRRTVFCGTVNDLEFLHDPTGNRRFWPIHATSISIDKSIDIQQLWAEAKIWYDAGEKWHLSPEEHQLVNSHNYQFESSDPIKELILNNYDFSTIDKSTRWLTATAIAKEIGIEKPSRSDVNKTSSIVRSQNRNQHKKSNGNRLLKMPLKKGSQ
jgi:hypothetical protein